MYDIIIQNANSQDLGNGKSIEYQRMVASSLNHFSAYIPIDMQIMENVNEHLVVSNNGFFLSLFMKYSCQVVIGRRNLCSFQEFQ